MAKSIRILLFLVLIGTQSASSAQIVAELVYPVIPIRDDCHYVFDDTSRVRVINKADFQQLDRLWHTKDFCYNLKTDTVYYTEFEIVFENVLGVPNGLFAENNGRLKSENQNYLNNAIKNLKSYTKVHIQNAQFENDGAMHQIPNFTFIIDSIIQPIEDTCFAYFTIPWKEEILITKDSLLRLFTNSFCHDKCTSTSYWPNKTNYPVLQITSFVSYSNPSANTYKPGLNYVMESNLIRQENYEVLSHLKPHDLVVIDPLLHQKNDEFYSVKGWRFKITD